MKELETERQADKGPWYWCSWEHYIGWPMLVVVIAWFIWARLLGY